MSGKSERRKRGAASLVLRLESGEQAASFRREVPMGDLREEIRFNYDGGTSSLFFRAKLIEMPAAPQLDVEPLRMDFGTIRPGEPITKRILLHNRGRASLKWQAGVAGSQGNAAGNSSPCRKICLL